MNVCQLIFISPFIWTWFKIADRKICNDDHYLNTIHIFVYTYVLRCIRSKIECQTKKAVVSNPKMVKILQERNQMEISVKFSIFPIMISQWAKNHTMNSLVFSFQLYYTTRAIQIGKFILHCNPKSSFIEFILNFLQMKTDFPQSNFCGFWFYLSSILNLVW